ncbi:MAG: hypothetical protein RLZZ46_500 [Bacteroidota bacterium]|jgi:uncharacterized damage-inducible protein DinB
MIHKPEAKEFPESYRYYVELVKGDDGLMAMEEQLMLFRRLIAEVSTDQESFAYAAGKWSVKELVGHVCDTERIFAYRALCIARGEGNQLPGFDENNYVSKGKFNQRSLNDLMHEFSLLRESNVALFRSFDKDMLSRRGMANNYLVSVRAILFMMLGHELHHQEVLRSRYLPLMVPAL